MGTQAIDIKNEPLCERENAFKNHMNKKRI